MNYILRANKLIQSINRLNISKAVHLSSSKKMSESKHHFDSDVLQARKSDHPIHPIFLSRSSPREMTGEDISDSELMSLFEASRWAPSHYNTQPWRFVYAKRNTDHWKRFIDLLWPPNQEWCQTAAALVVVISKRHFMYKGQKTPIPTHSYDAGSAWMSLALEGTARGLVVHGIGGFEYEKAYQSLNVPKDTHCVDAMIAIGKRPAKDKRKMKEQITQRNPIKSFVFKDVFVNNDKE